MWPVFFNFFSSLTEGKFCFSDMDKFSAEVKSEILEHAAGVAILLAAHGEPPEFTSDEIFCMLGKVS